MGDVIFVVSPFLRKGRLETEEEEFFGIYSERTKRMFSEYELQQYEKYMASSVELSGGTAIPVYDLPDPPQWISHLSPIAKRQGYKPEVLDLLHLSFKDYNSDDIYQKVKSTDADIFLFSSFTNNQHIVDQVAEAVKRNNPNAINIIGGHHASFTTKDVLSKNYDIVVRGEGEKTFEELLGLLGKGNYNLSTIKGISYKHERRVFENPDQILIEDLSSLPLPDFDILPDFYKNVFFGRQFASRGCPMKCSFCAEALWSKNYPRYKTVDRVMEEIELMKEKLNIKFLFLNDETFTTNNAFLQEFCREIPNSGLSWSCQTRADFINEEKTKLMAENGCRNVFFGAESADQNVLDINNKKIKVPAIRKACEAVKSSGMSVCTNWLVGLAGESRDSAIRTIKYAESLIKDGLTDRVDYYICVPYPGTDLYQRPEQYNVKVKSKDFSQFREDAESVMGTESLESNDIFELWKYGLRTFTEAMKSSD